MEQMIMKCKKAGVKIYADAVINHMAAGSGTGTAGSKYNTKCPRCEDGLYSADDFHHNDNDKNTNCDVSNYQDQHNVQFCDLVGRHTHT
jgi:alpha-amylase